MAGIQAVPLVGAGLELVDFANLPRQTFAFALQSVLCRKRRSQRALGLAPALPQCAQSGVGHAAIAVEQTADRVAAREALPGVLAVDVEQMFPNVAQLLRGGRAAVDPGAAFAAQVHTAAQQQAVAGVKTGLGQVVGEALGALKFGADFGARRAFADQAHVGARASDQLQGVNQDRFARACLAGEHGKAVGQFQV